jgi:hypothetical protein
VTTHKSCATILTACSLSLAAGCATLGPSPNSPEVLQALQLVSAGHTGCLPDDNEISNVHASRDGSGTWNATCKGKSYLCSAFRAVGGSQSYSCAPVAQ